MQGLQEQSLSTYIVVSQGAYGEQVSIINAVSREEAHEIADRNSYIWPGYDMIELDSTRRGIVWEGGGDNG